VQAQRARRALLRARRTPRRRRRERTHAQRLPRPSEQQRVRQNRHDGAARRGALRRQSHIQHEVQAPRGGEKVLQLAAKALVQQQQP